MLFTVQLETRGTACTGSKEELQVLLREQKLDGAVGLGHNGVYTGKVRQGRPNNVQLACLLISQPQHYRGIP